MIIHCLCTYPATDIWMICSSQNWSKTPWLVKPSQQQSQLLPPFPGSHQKFVGKNIISFKTYCGRRGSKLDIPPYSLYKIYLPGMWSGEGWSSVIQPNVVNCCIAYIGTQIHTSFIYFSDTIFRTRLWFHVFWPLPGEMIQFDEHIFFKWVGSTTN